MGDEEIFVVNTQPEHNSQNIFSHLADGWFPSFYYSSSCVFSCALRPRSLFCRFELALDTQ